MNNDKTEKLTRMSAGLSIVIPSYNRIQMLKNTLAAIVVQEGGFSHNLEIVIVDNGSDISLEENIAEFVRYLDIKLIVRSVKNHFLPGTARNIGVLCSKYDNIVFLDSDCIPSKNFLINHWNIISPPNSKVASIGHRVFIDAKNLDVKLIQSSSFFNSEFKIVKSESNYMSKEDRRLPELRVLEGHPAPYNCFHGCNIGLKRHHFIQVGMFDPLFDGYWGYEDIELGYRLFNYGIKPIYIPDAFVYHQEGDGLTLKDRLIGRRRNYALACSKINNFLEFRRDLGR
jgi:glycosyltransferase involved in cell wall biosynthesis